MMSSLSAIYIKILLVYNLGPMPCQWASARGRPMVHSCNVYTRSTRLKALFSTVRLDGQMTACMLVSAILTCRELEQHWIDISYHQKTVAAFSQ